MKKQNWIVGLVISLGISLIALSPRLIRMESLDTGFITIGIFYNFFFCFTCWISYQYLFNYTKWLKTERLRFFIAATVIISIGLYSFIYDYLFSFFSDHILQFPEVIGNKRPYLLLLRGMLISGLYFFISYYLYVWAEKQKNSLEIEKLKQAQLAANLSSLKEQLSPHFLFNTLNTLSSLTKEQPVKDFVAELASVYRYVLQYRDIDKATLQQEIAFIGSYLYIIKARLEEAIQVELNIDDSVLSTAIPPLTLQLLIENAIKHNVASTNRQLKISIRNEKQEYLVVTNNIQPKSSVPFSTGIGLSNVMQRYHLLFSKEIIIEKSDLFFTVKLPIV